MALHMSIGLLFLGGGRASLSRSKESIAALLVALFPRFPRSIEDNQYHLQPLRHIWVLAVVWRGLKTIDVETGKDAPVPLKIELHGHVDYTANVCRNDPSKPQRMRLMSPCLLPPLEDIISVCIASARYYPVKILASKKLPESYGNYNHVMVLNIIPRLGVNATHLHSHASVYTSNGVLVIQVARPTHMHFTKYCSRKSNKAGTTSADPDMPWHRGSIH